MARRTKRASEVLLEGHVRGTLEDITHVNVPDIYGTELRIYVSSNEFTCILSQPAPVIVKGAQHTAGSSPTAAIHLSPQTAKDLCLLLGHLLENYEKNWGEIETNYTRRLKEQAAAASKAKQPAAKNKPTVKR